MAFQFFLILFLIFAFFAPALMLLQRLFYNRSGKSRYEGLVSFIIPAYNEGVHIEKVIYSIFNLNYKNLEVIVVNDFSKDNTLEILKKLSKKFKLKIIENKKNIGKSASLNKAVEFAKGDILFFVDADTLINKLAFDDVLMRFSNKKVGGVSCAYRSLGNSFLQLMQAIEWRFLYFVLGAHNLYSVFSMWGGALAVRKNAFFESGKFSLDAITEDVDFALKLNKKGWKVEQSFYTVLSDSPSKFKEWFKQKLRWFSGNVQAFLKHFDVFVTNPIFLIFVLLSIAPIAFGFFYSNEFESYLFANFLSFFIFVAFFTLPYLIPAIFDIKNLSRIYKLLFVLPFTYIYLPISSVAIFCGTIIGIYKLLKLSSKERGW